jgi:hypothetical protein
LLVTLVFTCTTTATPEIELFVGFEEEVRGFGAVVGITIDEGKLFVGELLEWLIKFDILCNIGI